MSRYAAGVLWATWAEIEKEHPAGDATVVLSCTEGIEIRTQDYPAAQQLAADLGLMRISNTERWVNIYGPAKIWVAVQWTPPLSMPSRPVHRHVPPQKVRA